MKKQTKQKPIFNLWKYLVVMALLIIGFGFGCKFDFQISKTIYKDNAYAQWGGFTSNLLIVLSMFVITTYSLVLIFSSVIHKNKTAKILGIIVGVIGTGFGVIGVGSCISSWTNVMSNTLMIILNVIICCLLFTGSFCLVWFVFKNKLNTKTYKYSLVVLLTLLCAAAVKFVITPIWSRPRPSRVFDALVPSNEFKAVWQPQPFLLLKNYSATLKSFPSGHTIVSTSVLIGWIYLVELKQIKNKALNYSILVLSLLFIFLMGSMRIVGGKHFLTDVTMGAMISITFIYFSQYLWNKKILAC